MLKEKRNQGMTALLFITCIFLAIAGAMAFIQYQKANPKIAYSADTAKVSSETVYTEVYDISPEPIFPVNDKTEVWLVQYKDGYVGIQAKKGDKQIAKWQEAFDKISEDVPLYPLFHRKTPTAWDGSTLVDFKPISVTGLRFLDVGSTK